jgi:hypothetical protein
VLQDFEHDLQLKLAASSIILFSEKALLRTRRDMQPQPSAIIDVILSAEGSSQAIRGLFRCFKTSNPKFCMHILQFQTNLESSDADSIVRFNVQIYPSEKV